MQDCQGLSGSLLLEKILIIQVHPPSDVKTAVCKQLKIYIFNWKSHKKEKKEKEKLNRKKSSKQDKKIHSPLSEWQQKLYAAFQR